MATASNLITAEELFRRPDLNKHCELIRGEVITMSPAGGRHGEVAIELGWQLAGHVRANKLGKAYAAETGFILERDPDTVRGPDAAFIASDRLPEKKHRIAFLPIAPDFVAEVRSPSDSAPAMKRKAKVWLDFGVNVVITVDPEAEAVCRYQSTGEVDTFTKGDPVDCSFAVPGWILNTTQLFED